MERSEAVRVAPDPVAVGVSAFDWSSVAGGAVIAASLGFLLITFGAAVGFSFASPWTTTAGEVKAMSWIGAGWFLVVSLVSYLVGGYVAARLRARRGDGTQREAEIRDGLHGLGVWGLGVLLTVLMAWLAASQLGSGVAKLGQGAVGTAADASGYFADILVRRDQPGGAEIPQAVRTEVQRILARVAVTGELPDADKTYLAHTVGAQAGIDGNQAEQPVNQVINQAKEAANKACKAMALGGFLTAAAFMIALGAAWTGAQTGGHHREAGTIFRAFAPREAM